MGLGDIVSKVLTTYKADVSDHVKELQKLKGEQAKAAKAELDAQRKLNEGLENQIKTLAKVGLAIGAVAVIAKGAWETATFAIEQNRLSASAAGVNIESLRKATLGLRRDTELLADAAAMNNGVLGSSTEQMATVERAMVSLTRKGHDQAKVHELVLAAVTRLEVDGLKQLGIMVDKTGLSLDRAADRWELQRRLMIELGAEADQVKEGQYRLGEQFEVTGNRIGDSFDRVKLGIGELELGLEHFLGTLTSVVEKLNSEETWDFLGIGGAAQFFKDYKSQHQDDAAIKNALGIGKSIDVGDVELLDNPEGKAKAAAAQRDAEARRKVARELANRVVSELTEDLLANLERDVANDELRAVELGGSREFRAPRDGYSTSLGGSSMADLRAGALGPSAEQAWDLKELLNGQIAGEAADRQSKLESIFGPVGDFDVYARGFEMLTGAVGAAYDAWISGSMSASQAVKKFLGESIAAAGKQMAVEAVKEGAYALAFAAIGDPRAGMHAAAAAAFGAGAVIAGVAAKELGAGAAPPAGASAGAAPALPPGGAGGAGEHRTINVIYGNSFAEESPRERLHKAERMVNDALGSRGGTEYR